MPTPLVTPLPSLDRTAPDFREDVDTFFASQVPTFTVQVNTLADYLVVKSDAAASSATAAAGSASSAASQVSLAAAQVTLATTQANNSASSASAAATSRDQAQAAAAAAGAAAGLPALAGHGGDVLTVANDESGVLFASPVPKLFRVPRSSNTALTLDDRSKFFDCTGTFTQTFAAAAALGAGWYAYIRNSGSGVITLDPTGAETVDGLASLAVMPFQTRLVHCDGTALRTILISGYQIMSVVDEKPSGTGGGAATAATWVQRDLNTVRFNSIPGASLASNLVILPAGTYMVKGSAPGLQTNSQKIRLFNTTSGSAALYGSSEASGSDSTVTSRSIINGFIALSASSSLRLDHYSTSGAGGGNIFGQPTSISGIPETYSEFIFIKVS